MLTKNKDDIKSELSLLATSSDNEAIKSVIWRKFIKANEGYEKQIKNLFLQMFQKAGEDYIKRLNTFNVNENNFESFITIDTNKQAEEMEKLYKPLKESIYKEVGQNTIDKKLDEIKGR